MASSCLAVVQACLSGEPWQGSCACSPKDGPVCTAAPNRVTLLHALAMAAAPSATVASAAAPAPQVLPASLACMPACQCTRLASHDSLEAGT